MLEKIDLTKDIDKEEAKAALETMGERLSLLQRQCKEAKIPVIIVFEGIGAGGKGVQINKLIRYLDPRGFHVYAMSNEIEEESRRPFLWRYWCKTPAYGRIAIFDNSWYTKVLSDRYHSKKGDAEAQKAFEDIRFFEKQLTDDGAVIIKLYLYISQKEQKKRYEKLLENKETAWRVSDEALKRNKHYDEYLVLNEEMLENTDYEYAPWTIVEATHKDFAAVKIMNTVVSKLEEALQKKASKQQEKTIPILPTDAYRTGVLSGVDLSKTMEQKEYKKRLEELQDKLALLHSELYRRKSVSMREPILLPSNGRLRMRIGATGRNGMLTRNVWMKCS